MGAQESRSRIDESNPAPAGVEDYYGILEVEETATADEIKVRFSMACTICLSNYWLQRSFRRLALIHHPDKNHDDPEGATKRFATLQQAYEVRWVLS
jgi:DnaJ homolog subfamily A member 5